VPESTLLTRLEHRVDAVLDSAGGFRLVRLVREDKVGRAGAIAALACTWLALALLELRVALVAAACASVTWLRLKQLPPPAEPDPDDWL
jgi:hypothetical protein